MHSILSVLAFSVLLATPGAGKTTTKVCPLLGPAFPVPTGLVSNEHFQEAAKNVEAALNTTLATGMTPNNGPGPFNQTSFSIGIFSTTEKDLLYEFHYTDASVRNSSTGTKNVNSDSVYRLGSIGKVLSVYIFLIQDGDVHWNEPITNYIPELAATAANVTASPNGIAPKWNEITIGQLASHMGGLPRDCKRISHFVECVLILS
jgi:CubicO group peptidase (beta-lactamase class C family)